LDDSSSRGNNNNIINNNKNKMHGNKKKQNKNKKQKKNNKHQDRKKNIKTAPNPLGDPFTQRFPLSSLSPTLINVAYQLKPDRLRACNCCSDASMAGGIYCNGRTDGWRVIFG